MSIKTALPFALASWLCVGIAALAHAHEKPTVDKKAVTTTQPLNKAETEVSAVVEQFHTAIKNADSKLVEQVVAANVQIFEQGHRESSRAEYLSHHFKADAAFAAVVTSKTTAQDIRLDGNMAVVMAESTTDGIYKDKPVKGANLSTYVLKRENGQWQIVHIHWSSRKRS
ncbi:MAG: nuclear transport factor 2 family protein [Burkholderiales bacterium]|jgi:ketosteroid isomerase-like protein|nr:nuclear transport factor 2 family protein [Rhodocyclaceae bacterium]MCA3021278.1 nuclear transport factor 2 family protein [Rhodocyclaceae bacterium]MCA3052628.1 nuclear transport factor 2 family protein [Rhodocyclaceae bacterium]